MPKVTHHPVKAQEASHEPMRLLTHDQAVETHPALAGRLRTWIAKSDSGDPIFAGLKPAIVRVGRSVYIDDVKLRAFLAAFSSRPPAPSRRRA